MSRNKKSKEPLKDLKLDDEVFDKVAADSPEVTWKEKILDSFRTPSHGYTKQDTESLGETGNDSDRVDVERKAEKQGSNRVKLRESLQDMKLEEGDFSKVDLESRHSENTTESNLVEEVPSWKERILDTLRNPTHEYTKQETESIAETRDDEDDNATKEVDESGLQGRRREKSVVNYIKMREALFNSNSIVNLSSSIAINKYTLIFEDPVVEKSYVKIFNTNGYKRNRYVCLFFFLCSLTLDLHDIYFSYDTWLRSVWTEKFLFRMLQVTPMLINGILSYFPKMIRFQQGTMSAACFVTLFTILVIEPTYLKYVKKTHTETLTPAIVYAYSFNSLVQLTYFRTSCVIWFMVITQRICFILLCPGEENLVVVLRGIHLVAVNVCSLYSRYRHERFLRKNFYLKEMTKKTLDALSQGATTMNSEKEKDVLKTHSVKEPLTVTTPSVHEVPLLPVVDEKSKTPPNEEAPQNFFLSSYNVILDWFSDIREVITLLKNKQFITRAKQLLSPTNPEEVEFLKYSSSRAIVSFTVTTSGCIVAIVSEFLADIVTGKHRWTDQDHIFRIFYFPLLYLIPLGFLFVRNDYFMRHPIRIQLTIMCSMIGYNIGYIICQMISTIQITKADLPNLLISINANLPTLVISIILTGSACGLHNIWYRVFGWCIMFSHLVALIDPTSFGFDGTAIILAAIVMAHHVSVGRENAIRTYVIEKRKHQDLMKSLDNA